MAKDPAFLFYPGDYVSGTMHLDFECKGAYMDLLMLQFQKDHMSLHMIKQVLGHKFEHIWPLIIDKFQEKDGKYWNERLRIEKEKRLKFCKSRKDNRNKQKDMSPHMSQHMENENINENIDSNLCFNIEDFLNKNRKHFEALCMGPPLHEEQAVRDTIRAYHLTAIEKAWYPKKPLQMIAGISKWLLNRKNFKNNGRAATTSIGKTFEPD